MKTRALTPGVLTFTAGAASLAQAGVTVRDLTSLPIAGRTLVVPPLSGGTAYNGLSVDFDAAELDDILTHGTTAPSGADVTFYTETTQVAGEVYRDATVRSQNG